MCGRAKGGERTWSNCDRLQLSGLFPAVLRGDREGSPVGLGGASARPCSGGGTGGSKARAEGGGWN